MSYAIGEPVPWPLAPDWSDPVRETLAWLTNVIRSRNGTRQPRQLRLSPRRTFSFTVLADAAERRLLDAARLDQGARVWRLPIWHDGQRLAADVAAGAGSIACATTGYDFGAGGQALIWRGINDWELVDIDAVASGTLTLAGVTEASWSAGTRMWPVRAARLRNPPEEIARSDRVARYRVEFDVDEPCDWAAAAPVATYRTAPVLELARNEVRDPESSYLRLLEVVDVDTGPSSVFDYADQAFRLQDHHWLVHGRSNHDAFRQLLYWLAGRMSALWVPTFMSDLQLAAAIGSVDTTISVDWAGYTVFGRQQAHRQDIRIELHDGTVFYRRLTGSVEAGATETLTIDGALGQAVATTQVRAISFMAYCAQAADTVEIDHLTDADGTSRCATRFEALRHVL